MAETNQEATIIDSEATEVAESSSSTLPLPLIAALVAIVLSLIALFFAFRGGNGDSSSAVADLEARLAVVETAPVGEAADLSGVQTEIANVKTAISKVEADLAATVDAINAEFESLTSSMTVATNGETSTDGSAVASGLLGGDALSAVNNQIAGLSDVVDGSLANISALGENLSENQNVLSALTERVSAAEGLLNAIPGQLESSASAAMSALEEMRTSSASQFEGVQASIDEGMSAFAALSNQTEDALSNTRATVSTQFEEVSTNFGEQMSAFSASLDETKAATAGQFSALGDVVSGLSEEFTAMKEVSVETSTKVLAVNQLRDALASSAPVRPHMTSLEALKPTEEPLLNVLATVDTIADSRVPTQKILAATIRDLSPRLVTETRVNAAEGTGGKVLARLSGLVSVEKIEDIAAIPGIEGNMARAAARIEENDFEAALTELMDDTVEMNLTDETRARFDALVVDLGNRASYEDQRRILGDWVTTTLNSARATAAN